MPPGQHPHASSFHLPVLAREVVEVLEPRSGGTYFDGTLGGGGHAAAILDASSPDGRLFGVDRDPEAVDEATRRLAQYGDRAHLDIGSFDELATLPALAGIAFEGALLDLGVSSHQIDTVDRGFAFDADAPLDMRMGRAGPTAANLLNELPIDELADVFRRYGEEPFAGPLARAIAAARSKQRITSSAELKPLLRSAVPAHFNPVKVYARAFQALRIAVNDELGRLERGLADLFDRLLPGGRLVVLSYHSLEDRLVKRFFAGRADPCVCPPGLPVCGCGRTPDARLVTRGSVTAAGSEIERNPRARSVRLRAAERLGSEASPDREPRRGTPPSIRPSHPS